jgi:hypothetical protein
MHSRTRAVLLAASLLTASSGCFTPSVPETGVLCSATNDCPPEQRCEPVVSSCVPSSWPAVARLRFEPFIAPFEAGTDAGDVRVSLLDSADHIVPVSGGRLTLSLSSAPVDIDLAESPVVTVTAGIASFSPVRFDQVAKRLQLEARGGELSAKSAFFNVLPRRPVVTIPQPASVSGCAELPYAIAQAQGQRVDLLVEIDPDGPDGPAPFARATQAASAPGRAGVRGVASLPGSAAHAFSWNTTADVGDVDTMATVRMTASAGGLSGEPVTRSVQVLDGTHLQPVGSFHEVLAIGDLDRDGFPDMVESDDLDIVVRYGPYADSIPAGSGVTPAASSPPVSLEAHPDSAAIGDFDHDGRLDIVATDADGNLEILHAGAAPRTFGAPSWVFSSRARDVLATDVNGDGYDDIVRTGRDGDDVSVSLQDPTSSFPFNVSKAVCASQGNVGRVTVADVDHNGELDIVVGREGMPVAVCEQVTGKFYDPMEISGVSGAAVQVTDLDGDGLAEVAALGASGLSFVEIGLDGAVAGTATTLPGFTGARFTLGDVDGDGRQDIVTSGPAGIDVHLHVQDRRIASFLPPMAAGTSAADVASIVDLDRDGRADIASSPVLYRNRTVRRCGAGLAAPRGSDADDTLPVRDLNGDGKLDLLRLDASHHLQVSFGLGDGSFAAPVPLDAGAEGPVPVDRVALEDLDGDGLVDRVDLVRGAKSVTVRLQDPSAPGTYGAQDLDLGIEAQAISVADVDLDGALDVLAMGSNQAIIIPGDPRRPGHFLERTSLPGDIEASASSCDDVLQECSFLVADLDGDGWPEITVRTRGRLRVFPNDPDKPGTFGAPGVTDLSLLELGGVADLVGDGQPELLVIDEDGNFRVDAFELRTDHRLYPVWGVELPTDTYSLALADFDGDGDTDIALGPAHASVRIISPRDVPSGSALPPGRRLFAAGAVAVADLDSDGNDDLLVCGRNCLTVPSSAIITAMSDADFWTSVGSLGRLVVGDVDGDALLDLLVGQRVEHQLPALPGHFEAIGDPTRNDVQAFFDFDHDGYADVLAGGGVIELDPAQQLVLGPGHVTCGSPFGNVVERAADVDRDGLVDVVQWSYGGARLVRGVLGACTPEEPFVSYSVYDLPLFVGLADLDNDGWLDVVTGVDEGSSAILVSLQRPDAPGTFFAARTYPGSGKVSIGDVDHDGWLDIVYADYGVFAYRGSAATPGRFAAATPLVDDPDLFSAILGDVDGDGWLDIVAGELSGRTEVYSSSGSSPVTFQHAYDTVGASSVDQPPDRYLLDLDADGRLDLLFTDAQRGTTLVRGR